MFKLLKSLAKWSLKVLTLPLSTVSVVCCSAALLLAKILNVFGTVVVDNFGKDKYYVSNVFKSIEDGIKSATGFCIKNMTSVVTDPIEFINELARELNTKFGRGDSIESENTIDPNTASKGELSDPDNIAAIANAKDLREHIERSVPPRDIKNLESQTKKLEALMQSETDAAATGGETAGITGEDPITSGAAPVTETEIEGTPIGTEENPETPEETVKTDKGATQEKSEPKATKTTSSPTIPQGRSLKTTNQERSTKVG